jgi:hypothetical protein
VEATGEAVGVVCAVGVVAFEAITEDDDGGDHFWGKAEILKS